MKINIISQSSPEHKDVANSVKICTVKKKLNKGLYDMSFVRECLLWFFSAELACYCFKLIQWSGCLNSAGVICTLGGQLQPRTETVNFVCLVICVLEAF